ncbi:MAG: hypothetical protein ABWZ79_17555, partial [Pedobacter agri]
MKNILLVFTIILMINIATSAQVKIGGVGSPSAGAMLELESPNKGFTPPRINLTSLTMNLNGTV